jgi:hypothetical protein
MTMSLAADPADLWQCALFAWRIHYLILCDAQDVLPRLFARVVIPPTVFKELQQPNTPADVRRWAQSLPLWVQVQAR